jgi:hypothetical protein
MIAQISLTDIFLSDTIPSNSLKIGSIECFYTIQHGITRALRLTPNTKFREIILRSDRKTRNDPMNPFLHAAIQKG